MRLMTVQVAAGGPAEPAVVVGDELLSLRALGHASVRGLIAAGPDAWAAAGEAAAAGAGALPPLGPVAAVAAVLPPVPDPPRNAFCVGTNYRAHIDELDRTDGSGAPTGAPVVFTKPWTSLVGSGATVPLHPGVTDFVDWEAEFVAVIGTPALTVERDEALAHVFGYMLGNDVTARDLQKPDGKPTQWFKGKSLDGFAPTGPVLVTADEVGDPAGLRAELAVNGTVRQRLDAADMIHDVPAIVAHLSRGMRLLPGDLVFTGTAAGVGAGHEPPISLHDGDVVEITSARLGTLRNPFADHVPVRVGP
ncbi:MAG TPA: fumarylacetoacetate hydrolase family protein [Acidimicrobiales bacterium]|nr:fumarylacetoacetate hydrolase family protein [Acidimicrobiales bacterium]